MKEVLCIIQKPNSFCVELKEHIVENTVYKELGFSLSSNPKTNDDLFAEQDGEYFVAIVSPSVATDIYKQYKGNKDITIKFIMVVNYDHEADKTLCVSAIERLSVEGLDKMLREIYVDLLLDSRNSISYLTKQFDLFLDKENKLAISNDEIEEIEDVKMRGNIVYKCSLSETQAKAIVDKGFDKFEIHTDDRFLCDPDAVKSALGILDILPDILTVHTPLDSTCSILDEPSCSLRGIGNSKSTYNAVKRTMHFAQKCADFYEHRVGVVVHNYDTVRGLFIDIDCTILKKRLAKLLKKYPDVDLYIENTTPMEPQDGFGTITMHGGVFDDVPMMCHILNDALCAEGRQKRFYSCLDTCHMLSSIRVYKALELSNEHTMKSMFEKYADTCAQIHFAYCKKFGVKLDEHGVGFQGNINIMNEWLTYIDEYMPMTNIVLEMREKDYYNPVNSVHAVEYINKFRQ